MTMNPTTNTTTLDRQLDRLERTTKSLDGMLYRLRTGQSGGRNSAATETGMRSAFERGRTELGEACALATDADDQPGTRFDRVARRWNRAERRYLGLPV